MRRALRLTAFTLVASIVVVGIVWTFRGRILAPFGMNFDTGAAKETALVVPDGFSAGVFASGLASPRFMALSATAPLRRTQERTGSWPRMPTRRRADEVIVVGSGYDALTAGLRETARCSWPAAARSTAA
jgi:hypothetical protein